MWNSVLLRIYFFPNCFFHVGINDISQFNCLKLRSYPNSLLRHVFLDFYIRHFNVTNFYWSFLFWFFFFTFLLILCSFFSLLSLLFQSELHFLLCFISLIGFDNDRILCRLFILIISFNLLNTLWLIFIYRLHRLGVLVCNILRFYFFNFMNWLPPNNIIILQYF